MLASLAASKTARLIAACVCPVVGAGTLTMAVPKVRNAVHKATAPREYALPKTRDRVAAAPLGLAGPCPTIGSPQYTGIVAPLGEAFTPDTLPNDGPPVNPFTIPGPFATPNPNLPGGGGGGGGGVIPEPHVWLQLLVGFMLVGGSIRLARRELTEDDHILIDRVEELKNESLKGDVRP